jgi:hypothetical protein
MVAEISYDMVMDDDMSFVEGTYRLPGRDWKVVIVSGSERDVPSVQVEQTHWDSGVTGVVLRIPRAERINADKVEQILSDALGVTNWIRVRGPDSMGLR